MTLRLKDRLDELLDYSDSEKAGLSSAVSDRYMHRSNATEDEVSEISDEDESEGGEDESEGGRG